MLVSHIPSIRIFLPIHINDAFYLLYSLSESLPYTKNLIVCIQQKNSILFHVLNLNRNSFLKGYLHKTRFVIQWYKHKFVLAVMDRWKCHHSLPFCSMQFGSQYQQIENSLESVNCGFYLFCGIAITCTCWPNYKYAFQFAT